MKWETVRTNKKENTIRIESSYIYLKKNLMQEIFDEFNEKAKDNNGVYITINLMKKEKYGLRFNNEPQEDEIKIMFKKGTYSIYITKEIANDIGQGQHEIKRDKEGIYEII